MKHTLSLLCLSLMMMVSTTVNGQVRCVQGSRTPQPVETRHHVCHKHCNHHECTPVKPEPKKPEPRFVEGHREFNNNSPEVIRQRQEMRRGVMPGCR